MKGKATGEMEAQTPKGFLPLIIKLSRLFHGSTVEPIYSSLLGCAMLSNLHVGFYFRFLLLSTGFELGGKKKEKKIRPPCSPNQYGKADGKYFAASLENLYNFIEA